VTSVGPAAGVSRRYLALFDPRNGDEALGPPVLVEGVPVDHEAIRFITKPGQWSCVADDAFLSLPLRGVGAEDLHVVTVLLVPLQGAVLTAMTSRSSVGKPGVPHMPKQVDIHPLTVRACSPRRAINGSKIGCAHNAAMRSAPHRSLRRPAQVRGTLPGRHNCHGTTRRRKM
jgi:hypothetical protein